LDVNLERMFTVLRVPWAKTCMEVVDIARDRITSVNTEVGKDISTEDVSNALIEGFRRGLSIELVDGQLTSHERECAQELCEKKYITNEWNFHGKASSKL
jgi:lipoate-protein ligase A